MFPRAAANASRKRNCSGHFLVKDVLFTVYKWFFRIYKIHIFWSALSRNYDRPKTYAILVCSAHTLLPNNCFWLIGCWGLSAPVKMTTNFFPKRSHSFSLNVLFEANWPRPRSVPTFLQIYDLQMRAVCLSNWQMSTRKCFVVLCWKHFSPINLLQLPVQKSRSFAQLIFIVDLVCIKPKNVQPLSGTENFLETTLLDFDIQLTIAMTWIFEMLSGLEARTKKADKIASPILKWLVATTTTQFLDNIS